MEVLHRSTRHDAMLAFRGDGAYRFLPVADSAGAYYDDRER